MTTGDAHGEIDWRAIQAISSLSISHSTAARISPYKPASDRLSERMDVCCVNLVKRKSGNFDIIIVRRESFDELRVAEQQRLFVSARVRQAIDLDIVQHLFQFLFSRQPKNCSSCWTAFKDCTTEFTAAPI